MNDLLKEVITAIKDTDIYETEVQYTIGDVHTTVRFKREPEKNQIKIRGSIFEQPVVRESPVWVSINKHVYEGYIIQQDTTTGEHRHVTTREVRPECEPDWIKGLPPIGDKPSK